MSATECPGCGNRVKPDEIDLNEGRVDYVCEECGREWSIAAGQAHGEGPPPPVAEVDYLYVQLPQDLRHMPRHWDPELAFELGKHRDNMDDVTLVDWAFYRTNVNVISDEIKKYRVRKDVVLWGGPESYRYLQQLVPFLEEYVVVGFSKKLSSRLGLPVRLLDKKVSHYTVPNFDLFDVGYFAQSKLPFTIETQTWGRRIPIRFRFRKSIRPRRAAEILRSIKMKYWFDSLDWVDNVTADREWTLKLLDEMTRLEVVPNVQFVCKASYRRIDAPLLRELKEAGCKVISYGEIPTSIFDDDIERQRIQAAMFEAQRRDIFPSFTVVLDEDSNQENCRAATEFMVAIDGLHRPQVKADYEKASEEDILSMNNGTWNPTSFSDVELLGVQAAMEKGWLDALKG